MNSEVRVFGKKWPQCILEVLFQHLFGMNEE